MSTLKKILEAIHIEKGDITAMYVDAIVNAANTSLLGGGGVDGAIHRAAGPGLLEECRKLGGCRTGEARITGGYNLKARYVIHTPGPVYRGGSYGEPEQLAKCYFSCLFLANQHSCSSIAFPAISTGVYNYPLREACDIAFNSIISYCTGNVWLPQIFFVLFNDANHDVYCLKKKELSGNELS